MSLNGAVAVALIPEISKANILNSKEKLKQSINYSLLITLFITVPSTLGLFFYSDEIINFLYPNANKGAELLKLGCLTLVFTSLSQTMSGILQGMGDSKSHLKAVAIAMTLKLILNFVFIPMPSLLEKGAILSSSICDMVIFVIMYVCLRKKLGFDLNIIGNILKIFAISILAIFVSKILMTKLAINFYIKFVIEIFIVVIIYIILSLKTKIIDIKKVLKSLGF
jgi:stage V sporulation protein B